MIDVVLFDRNAIQLRVGDRGSELTIVDFQVQAEGEIVSFAGIIQALTKSTSVTSTANNKDSFWVVFFIAFSFVFSYCSFDMLLLCDTDVIFV